LRIQEALALAESDLDQRRGALLVRRGKGGRRREVGMDAWGWEERQPWLELRPQVPVGPLFCVINGRHAAAFGQAPPGEPICAGPPSKPVSGGASRHTSCGTRMPSSSHARACR
jgi:hypothetical protein